MGIELETLVHHVTQLQATTVASLHDPKPNASHSFFAVLRQVSFCLPYLLPSGAHINVVLGIFVWIHFKLWSNVKNLFEMEYH